MSPPLIRKVREYTRPGALTIIDAPPGTSCPVIASLGGATAVVIVAEPTVSGRHNMERVAELAAFFKIPAMICVNKFDLNPDMGQAIEAFARALRQWFRGKPSWNLTTITTVVRH